jgi:integrase
VLRVSLEDYRATNTKHIIPAIGHIPAQRLTPEATQSFYADLRDKGVGARTVQLCHLRLSQALARAVTWGVLHRNVCDATDKPRSTPQLGHVWSAVEAQRFLAACEGDTLGPFWLLIVTTGLRRGEALELRWEDLHLDARTLRVAQSVVIHEGRPVVQHPKSPAARRMVNLLPEAVIALRAHRATENAHRLELGVIWHDNDVVFATGEGKLLNPNNLYRKLNATIRIQNLRHNHATLLLAAGQPVKVVSERLSHAKTSITLETISCPLCRRAPSTRWARSCLAPRRASTAEPGQCLTLAPPAARLDRRL